MLVAASAFASVSFQNSFMSLCLDRTAMPVPVKKVPNLWPAASKH